MIALSCALLPGFFFLASAKNEAPASAAPLVHIQRGDLPIILSAPHGGRREVPGIEPRKGKDVRLFRTLTDAWTDPLTEKLAAEIEKQTGKRPYLVIAKFHRKFIDANRPAKFAYESDKAKATYDAYHAALAEARREIITRWGRGLLLDIHGQASLNDTIIRGSQNGQTTSHLVQKFGPDSLTGTSSLFGELAQKNFPVNPTVGSQKKEHSKYNGGHIVQKYGSSQGGTFDAIQLELGRNLRRPENNSDTASRMAEAIHQFSLKHLPQQEVKTVRPSAQKRSP